MRANSLFFQTQIDQCTAMAASAGLANQRDMFLRSLAAWQALADKDAATEVERLKRRAV
jgi:hypothetical protein